MTLSIEEAINKVLENDPGRVADYHAGKASTFGYLLGRVMSRLPAGTDAHQVNKMLWRRLNAKG